MPQAISDADWAQLDKEATAKALNFGSTIRPDAPAVQHEAGRLHREAVKKSGSYLSLQAKIAYSAWRLGELSPCIAEQVGLPPSAVRQCLNRMLQTARALGYDCGKKQHNNQRGESKLPAPPKTTKVCAMCFKEFDVVSVGGGRHRKFCTPECLRKARLKRLEEKKRSKPGLPFCSTECKQKFKETVVTTLAPPKNAMAPYSARAQHDMAWLREHLG